MHRLQLLAYLAIISAKNFQAFIIQWRIEAYLSIFDWDYIPLQIHHSDQSNVVPLECRGIITSLQKEILLSEAAKKLRSYFKYVS